MPLRALCRSPWRGSLCRKLRYADTQLCAPGDASFQSWLKTVASHEGTGAVCTPLSDRDILKAALQCDPHGPSWDYNRNWLSNAPTPRLGRRRRRCTRSSGQPEPQWD